MVEDLNSAFVPIKDQDGKVTGMMDRQTADYLSKDGPHPTQQSLDAMLSRVTRVRIAPLRCVGDEERILLDTSNPQSIKSLCGCLVIDETAPGFHCMCLGDPHLEFYAGDELIAKIGYHHGISIRWSAWHHDARLRLPVELLAWMTAHGVDGPQREVDAMRAQADKRWRQWHQWLQTTPECLRHFSRRLSDDCDAEFKSQLRGTLLATYGHDEEVARVLFAWFGSGVGPWSGFPSYERLPELLLLEMPTPLLIRALEEKIPAAADLLGAARYFTSWWFWQQKKKDFRLVSPELKARMLAATEATGLERNIAEARHKFAN